MSNINEDKFVAKLTRISDGTKVEKEVEAVSYTKARELFKSMANFCNPTGIHKKTHYDEI